MLSTLMRLLVLSILTCRATAKPVKDYNIFAPVYSSDSRRLTETDMVVGKLQGNETIEKREGGKCHYVSFCKEPKYRGKCITHCYPPDEFVIMASEWQTETKSIRMRQGAECWFYRTSLCEKNRRMTPKQFIVWPGADLKPPILGNVGCMFCPNVDADYFE
ncbi:hypothetical protein CCHR01_02717 [Colletotrichum chrysophilum]|uniref:Uncharacterized protein n=1 Tax=Colletotrichum chrysophilum TaxID=1836956 RepID=A0AAD9AUA6_9PEZI|nr:hypothetical protein CCHR01_02717 [Colletotrichum chrysophilum]